MDNNKKLFIGLDVGSDSVGWAATDEDYNLCRLKGKTAWGARLFTAASDAKGRRALRVSGRRLARRKRRINLLNTLFDPLLKEVDPTFLQRLEYSTLQNDDPNKPESTRSDTLLFLDKKKEKEFYKAYPTIWHLRRDMINGDEKAFSDIRYLYLAVHHIIKYRGNFLREGEINTDQFDVAEFGILNDLIGQAVGSTDDDGDEMTFAGIPESNYELFVKTALDKSKGKSQRKKELIALTDSGGNEFAKGLLEMFCTLAVGSEFNTKKLNPKNEDPRFEEIKISIDKKYDENEANYHDVLDDLFGVVEIAKAVYDFCDLHDILKGQPNLSSAFACIYDSHKDQKKALKDICKEIDEAEGNLGKKGEGVLFRIFKDPNNENNYCAFTHNNSVKGRCEVHAFDQYVLSEIEPKEELIIKNRVPWAQLKTLIALDEMMQTVAIRSTSVIPMQLHKKELVAILNNAIKFNVPGILDIRDQLIELFSFRVPYYCGPLNTKSAFTNMVLKNGVSGPINPWNYKDKIDFEATKKKFMMGLTNKCTYLKDCSVLPSSSLLFRDAMTWDKLNNLRVNGNRLSPDEMKRIYNELVVRRPKTTLSQAKNFIVKHMSGEPSKSGDYVVTGWNDQDAIDNSPRAALTSAFHLTDDRNTPEYQMCEDIIYLKTVFTDSEKDAMEAIAKKYSLNGDQLTAVKKLKCKGWATLSKEFLTLSSDKTCVEPNRLIDVMMAGEGNMMEVLHSSKYEFNAKVDRYNTALFEGRDKDDAVEEIVESIPPKMRRSVIQAIRIVKEVSKVAKKEPAVISIEVTREDNDQDKKKKKVTKSRKDQLDEFLKGLVAGEKKTKGNDSSLKEAASDARELLQDYGIDELRGKHLYLYFLQCGIDLYTGEKIDIQRILDGSSYDTDHILPQSLIKDDSLDNLVLVNRATNQHKSNSYPLPPSIQCKMKPTWRRLRDAGMLSAKKYANLTRTTPLTESELNSFVSAQINVVNHSNVAIRDALKVLYPHATLIFSKAQYPSQVRKELSIPKLRDLNDTHHAVDAYLNIVCGDILTKTFGRMEIIKKAMKSMNEEEEPKASLNMEKFISRSLASKDGVLTDLATKIVANSRRHDFLLTYRFLYQDAEFYKQTIYGPKDPNHKADTLIPIHDGMDSLRYGGFNEMKTEYNCVAIVRGPKKTTKFLLGVPHLLDEKRRQGADVYNRLLALVPHKSNEIVDIDLEHPISLWTIVKISGVEYLLGSYGDQIKLMPVSPIFLSPKSADYLDKLIRYVEKRNDLMSSNGGLLGETTLEVPGNRFSTNKIIFSNSQSLLVLDELLKISRSPCYDYCSMVAELRDETKQDSLRQQLLVAPFSEQLKIILSVLGVFTRKSEALSNRKNFRKSRASILSANGFTILSKSITGLYQTEKKL